MNTASIFNIQRFSLHDGPGIRTTVFVKGCPLRCAWCHNPESMDPRSEVMVKADRCIGCEACLPVCELGLAARLDGPGAVPFPGETCLRCGECVTACPSEARQMSGEEWEVEALLAELSRDGVFHEESAGGVTFSGGEPLAAGNEAFVLTCLRELKERGVHTAVDTCGSVPTETLLAAAAVSNLVLFDLKIMDAVLHKKATGRDNELILENLTALLAAGHEVWIRIPLIPGQTSDLKNLQAAADFLGRQDRVPPVHLLPYHGTGADKYHRLGRTNPLPDVQGLAPAEIEACTEVFRARGISVQVGG